MIERTVIEEIVLEVLKNLDRDVFRKPDLFVINASAEEKKQLEKHWNVHSISSTCHDVPNDVQEVAFFNVTQDLIVKGALGITDTPESKMLSHLMMKGLRISLIPSIELEWILKSNEKKATNPNYVNHLLNYKNMLKSFGVYLQSLEELVPRKAHSKESTNLIKDQITFHEKLLTQRHVENSEETKIMIHKSTIVTPLARDTARKLGKSIYVIE
ncbi:hypothetical protein DCC39_02680 [Pueribacillus theae]|uniref:Ethanolamine utilization protein n=1 Tax=Pueribacillus theae TaxID=2171751 RepID=A0A2U1K725_9BACI|nr:hypothetical protein [Pueribacillus theae]PWA13055.1 hypothetical protein DCC39_02680 [Pueribacillus theae]